MARESGNGLASTPQETTGSLSQPNEEADTSTVSRPPKPTWILRWRPIADFKVEFDVTLDNDQTATLTEFEVQLTRPDLVYGFWYRQHGRDLATGFDHYPVFRVLSNRRVKGELKYKIQWVGFNQLQSSWESPELLADMCLKTKEAYDEMHNLA
ncbi:hypothetical protein HG530_014625 [Fusarium avenaceum]|nr:hypothetical protein HG530_014625 [Fusarium avenaceum]